MAVRLYWTKTLAALAGGLPDDLLDVVVIVQLIARTHVAIPPATICCNDSETRITLKHRSFLVSVRKCGTERQGSARLGALSTVDPINHSIEVW